MQDIYQCSKIASAHGLLHTHSTSQTVGWIFLDAKTHINSDKYIYTFIFIRLSKMFKKSFTKLYNSPEAPLATNTRSGLPMLGLTYGSKNVLQDCLIFAFVSICKTMQLWCQVSGQLTVTGEEIEKPEWVFTQLVQVYPTSAPDEFRQ